MDLPRLFVYGTLQPGHLRWPFLEPFAAGHRAARVAGHLYDSGHGWPIARFRPGVAVVPGTLVDIDPTRVGEALTLLDEVEASATDLLARVRVTTIDAVVAWAYHAAAPGPDMVRIDRWVGRHER